MKSFLILLLSLALCLVGCAPKNTSEPPEDEPTAPPASEEMTLILDGRRYSFDGDSDRIRVEKDEIALLAGGTYRVRGTLTEGALRVCAPPDATVRLILDTAEITSSYHAPLFLEEAACVILEAAEGTVNRLTDKERKATDSPYPAGCLVSHCDLILRGSGSLCVSARQNTALVCAEDLTVTELSLSLTAPADGIWVRDRLSMESGSITVSAAKRGIVTDVGDASLGVLELSGGRLTLSCAQVALSASTRIRIGDALLSLNAPMHYQTPKVERSGEE